MGKNHIERILYIDNKIRNNRYPSRKEVAEYFEVSIKTVERDISYLRDRLMAPISYDRAKGGYYYYKEGYFLPSIYMTESEALTLFISHHLGCIWNDTPFSEAAKSAWEAFEGLLTRSSDIPIQSFSEFVHVINRSPKADSKIWTIALKSAAEQRKLFIEYSSPGYSKSVKRTIHPYRLIHHRDAWYILGFDEYRKDIRVFALFRIKNYKELQEKFYFPKGFNLFDYIDPHLGLFKKQELFTVRIRGESRIIEMFSEHIPGKEIVLKRREGGNKELSFSTNQKEEIKYLIMQYGSSLQVLQPEWLRRFLYDVGQSYCSFYGKDSPVAQDNFE